MSAMSNLDLVLDEMITAGQKMIDAAEELKKLFSDTSADAPAKEKAPAPKAEAAPEAKTPAKAEAAPEAKKGTPAEEAKKYSFQEVRGIMAALAGQGKKAEAKELLTKFGASRLSEVKEEDYTALAHEAEVKLHG